MASITDVYDFVKDLTIVSTGDGFDLTLSDSQVERLKKTLTNALTPKSSSASTATIGSRSPVRVTNMRRVILPVAWTLAWPYLAMLTGTSVLLGIWIAKAQK